MSKDGIYKKLETEKQDIKNLFLRIISELKPHVWANLPFSEYKHLTRSYLHLERGNLKEGAKNGTDWLNPKLFSLIEKDGVSVDELLSILPNADEKSIEKDFVEFKRQMLIWAEKYHLKKDWIFQSVCSAMENYLMRLQKGEQSKLIVGGFVYASTVLPVEVIIKDSWNPLQESFSEYENRVKQTLKYQKRTFAGQKIEGYKLKTKSTCLTEKIKWLVLWNIEEWTTPDIVINDLEIKPGKTQNANKRYEQQLKYVYDEIQKLKLFDLPVRKRQVKRYEKQIEIAEPPICLNCRHKTRDNKPGFRCAAFPGGIPEEIIASVADHRQPYKNDNGLQYEPIKNDWRLPENLGKGSLPRKDIIV